MWVRKDILLRVGPIIIVRHYSYHHFGEEQADRYINQISGIFQVMSGNNIGTPQPELGEYIFALHIEGIYFIFC